MRLVLLVLPPTASQLPPSMIPRADFFTLAVRTGKAGPGGISLLLVDAKTPGFRVRNGGGSWVKFGDDLGRGWGLTPVDVGFFSGGI